MSSIKIKKMNYKQILITFKVSFWLILSLLTMISTQVYSAENKDCLFYGIFCSDNKIIPEDPHDDGGQFSGGGEPRVELFVTVAQYYISSLEGNYRNKVQQKLDKMIKSLDQRKNINPTDVEVAQSAALGFATGVDIKPERLLVFTTEILKAGRGEVPALFFRGENKVLVNIKQWDDHNNDFQWLYRLVRFELDGLASSNDRYVKQIMEGDLKYTSGRDGLFSIQSIRFLSRLVFRPDEQIKTIYNGKVITFQGVSPQVSDPNTMKNTACLLKLKRLSMTSQYEVPERSRIDGDKVHPFIYRTVEYLDGKYQIIPISLKISFPDKSDILEIECIKSKSLRVEPQNIFANKSDLEVPTLDDINSTLHGVIEITEALKKVNLEGAE